MSNERLYILVSIPQEFKDKFMGFMKNINTLNSDGDPPVRVEDAYIKKKFAAVPKKIGGR